jgi:hypothetical protein
MLFRPNNETEVEIYGWVMFKHIHPEWPTSFHLVGMIDGCGRVCSPLQSVEETEEDYIFISRSGKKYTAPKKYYRGDSLEYLSNDAKHVLGAWIRMNSGEPVFTTTDEFKKTLS